MGESPLDRELTICDMNCFLEPGHAGAHQSWRGVPCSRCGVPAAWRVGDAVYCRRCTPGAVALPEPDPDSGMARVDRTRCCAGWPDPCVYHQGWEEGWDCALDAIKGERGVDWELEDR